MEEHLHILWTNAYPVVFDKMVLMYAVNSLTHGWWEKVTVILWGESARLAVEDPAVAGRIRLARAQGVAFSACVSCARELGVEEQLREMGGQPYWHVGLQDDSPEPHWKILDTFVAKHPEDYGYGKRWLAYAYPPAHIDREAWEPCGRPRTPEAFSELEKRLRG